MKDDCGEKSMAGLTMRAALALGVGMVSACSATEPPASIQKLNDSSGPVWLFRLDDRHQDVEATVDACRWLGCGRELDRECSKLQAIISRSPQSEWSAEKPLCLARYPEGSPPAQFKNQCNFLHVEAHEYTASLNAIALECAYYGVSQIATGLRVIDAPAPADKTVLACEVRYLTNAGVYEAGRHGVHQGSCN